MKPSPIRVFIVEKAPLTCVLIAATLSHEPGFEVIGFGPSVNVADLSQLERCDFILINATLSSDEALHQVHFTASVLPHVKCVVMGLPDSEVLIASYMNAGAVGYVLAYELAEALPRYLEVLHQVPGDWSS